MDDSSAGNFDTLFEESKVKIEVNTDDDVELDTESSSNIQSFQEIKKEKEEEGMILDENELLTHSYFIEDTVVKIEYDPEGNSSDKPFQCDKCEKSFKNKWHLAKHETVHDEFVYCPVCREKFSSEELCRKHKEIPGIHKTFQCKHCPYTSPYKHNVYKHSRKHSPVKQFKCDQCEKSFQHARTLSDHKATHEGYLFCPVCHKKCLNENQLREHNETPGVHKTFRCKHCQYATFKKGNFKSHMSKHLSDRPYVCDICKKSYTRKNYLSIHITKYHGFKCTICEKKFPSEKLLGEHKSTPDIHETLQCEHCPYSTIIKRNYTNHISRHSMAGGFTCDVCEKIFKWKRNLSFHMARYHGFHCAACRKKFPNENLLEEHKATPGIHKTLQCEQCPYSTIVKGNFASHIRTHSSETLNCEVCKKSFKWQKNLTRHLAKHAGFADHKMFIQNPTKSKQSSNIR